MVAAAATSVVVARHYGVEAFGAWSIAMVYGTLVRTILEGGLGRILIREVARDGESAGRYLTAVLRARLTMSVVVVPVALAIAWLVNSTSELWVLVALLVVARQVEALQSSFASVLFSFGRFASANIIETGKRLGAFVAVAIVVAVEAPIQLAAAVVAVSVVLSTIPLWRATRAAGVTLDSAGSLIGLRRDALWFWLGGVLFWVNGEVDQFMLGALVGAAPTGVYSAAMRVVGLLAIFPLAVNNAVMPRLFRSAKSGVGLGLHLNGTTLLLASVGSASAVELYLARGDIIHVLYGAEFRDAADVLAVLAIYVGLDFCRLVPSWYVTAVDRLALNTAVLGVAAGLNVALNVWLIPQHGAVGAAWATAMSGAFVLTVLVLIQIVLRGLRALVMMLVGSSVAIPVAGLHIGLTELGLRPLVAGIAVGFVYCLSAGVIYRLLIRRGVPAWLSR